jgi:multiple sugar transport system substrate-binding protein
VNVLQLELGALVQKVALDIGSGEGAYQVVYADPYQIMAPYHEALADLTEFNADENLPSIPRGTDDFIPPPSSPRRAASRTRRTSTRSPTTVRP